MPSRSRAKGDFDVADADGVVVVRRDEVEQVLVEAERIEANEIEQRISHEAAG